MGSNQARRRELPADLVRRADLIVADSIEQSRMESGDLLLAFSSESDWERVVELKDVTAGRFARKRPTDITLFKSNGLAVEDVIAAGWVYERAAAIGRGTPDLLLNGHLLLDLAPGADLETAAYPAKRLRADARTFRLRKPSTCTAS